MTSTMRIAVLAVAAFLCPMMAVVTWHWHDVYDYFDVQPQEVRGKLLYFMAPT